VEKDAKGNDVLVEFKDIVRLKIVGLWNLTENWLVDRLTDAVTKRRQQFYYQRAHAKRRGMLHRTYPIASLVEEAEKLATADASPGPAITAVDPNKPSDIQLISSEEPREELHKDAKTAATMETYTTVSQLNFVSDDGHKRQPVKPTRTELRIDESIFPSLPSKGQFGTFQCTQCFETLPEEMRKPDAWKYQIPSSSLIALESTYSPTFDPTLVFPRLVLEPTNFLKRETRGLSMNFTTIIMNGFAMGITIIPPALLYFLHPMSYEITFWKHTKVHLRNPRCLF